MKRHLLILAQLFLVTLILSNYLFPPTKSVNYALSEGMRTRKLVIVIVDSAYYNPLRESLNQLRNDLENEGWIVEIVSTEEISSNDFMSIRNYLCNALNRNLKGVLLIGNIPAAWVEANGRSFPTDMYYMDLDGLWIDKDEDGLFDTHLGDTEPEIWVGRIKPLTLSDLDDSIRQVRYYLLKDHKYRSGRLALPSRALAYIDDDGILWADDAKRSLEMVVDNVTLICNQSVTNARDFKKRLHDPIGFQWLYLMSHGEIGYNCFYEYKSQNSEKEWGGAIYSTEYPLINPRIMFYLMFTCSAGRYTDEDYLAGALVFKTTFGLISISSTDLMFSMSFENFFASLNKGICIGDSFLSWLDVKFEVYNFNYSKIMRELYGLSIIGDPTLVPCRETRLFVHDVSISDAHIYLNENGKAIITIRLTNKGAFVESLDLSLRYYSLLLTEKHITLNANETVVVSLDITYPYKVEKRKESGIHEITVEVSSHPEEYNIGDNVEHVILRDIIIEKVTPTTLPVLSRVLIFIMFVLLLPWLFFKSIGSSTDFYKGFKYKKFLSSQNLKGGRKYKIKRKDRNN